MRPRMPSRPDASRQGRDQPSAGPILIVSGRLTTSRAEALSRLVPAWTETTVVGNAPLPDPAGYAGFVVDDPDAATEIGADAPWLRTLREKVMAGAALLVLGPAPDGRAADWQDLAPARSGPQVPGEVFAKVADDRHPLVERMPQEWSIHDRFVPL